MAERYQWTQGPYNGEIETVNCEDDNYVYFDSGRKCSKQKLGYVMFQTSDSEDVNDFGSGFNAFEDEIRYGGGRDYSGDLGIDTTIPDEFKEDVAVVKKQVVESNPELPNHQVFNIQQQYEGNPLAVKKEPSKEQSPVSKLLSMQKEEALYSITVPVHINIKCPGKSFIEILLNTFDKELVMSELTSYMEEQVNIENIQETIKSSINEQVNKICGIND